MEKASKVAIYPCGGVGFVLSSVARYAAYVVTEDMLPGQTEIVDAVRLISGIPDEIKLVEENPSIILDGCAYQCGSNLFRLLGIKPAARILLPPIAKMPPTFVCDCKKQETKLAPGTNRRVPGETGRNLAMEVATQAQNACIAILNLNYPYERQKVNCEQNIICDYVENIPKKMKYVTVNERIERPEDMPAILGLE
ncbi:putative zinc-binding protein [Candidatus Contubernalis alkaliaceticus]|uniref:putative zinc-binding protein n=1 Tax=Candidatus Contubernalis alkaliaceticus TaxID=338645 RepID=UPI001F4C1681|nr:putative zinc-binding protein [Candidatus Contubernalis alkalaceticus]UNC91578.1 hypothetical protein HUE98_05440 [Candidatus Contubernalis alkalaceticus]